MKIVKASEMGRIEKIAYSEGASEENFMMNAGQGVADAIQRFVAKHHLKPHILLLCGKGNNAGDAYVAGTLLQAGCFNVSAIAIAPLEECSHLCKLQANRFLAEGGKITFLKEASEIDLSGANLLVDGIYGTGFRGSVTGIAARLIEKANASGLPIFSIDIPSGVDGTTGEIGNVAIKASATLFLGLPKSGCFVGDAWNHVGKCDVFNFGLQDKYIKQAKEEYTLIEENILTSLPPIERNRHKYEAGYVVGLGGSPGMPGALLMAGFAALRAGAGIVRVLHPVGMEHELSNAPFVLIRQGYKDAKTALTAMEKANAVFIGPGIGISLPAAKLLKKVLPAITKPCVIDAEALTLIAADKIPFPENAMITPHHGEMKRLLGIHAPISHSELILQAQEFAEKHEIIVVLKGSPTMIMQAGKKPLVCSRGDPGMATAGAGDVLTGILSALLAQKMSLLDAAGLGVYLHALAGEQAAEKYSSYSVVATDITDSLPEVFKKNQKRFF